MIIDSIQFLIQEINYTPRDLLNHDAIGAIVKNENNEILMLDHVKYDFWTIPVGKAEHLQSASSALKQELFEEVNIKITSFKLLDKQSLVYSRGEGNPSVQVTEHLFEVLTYTGTPENKEPHKHRDMRFMSIDQIKKLPRISNFTKTMFNYIK